MQKLSYKTLFNRYRDDTVVQKAVGYARWTLPKLMAELANITNGVTTVLERDYQEIGALLVNNLAAKLAGLLFPSSRPFYKIKPSAGLKAQAKQKGIEDSVLSGGLAKLELDSCQQLFLNASYEQLVLALAHLIVTGNVLLFRDPKLRKTITYGIQSFALRRDGRGTMMDCILREFTDFEALPPDVQALLLMKHPSKYKGYNEGKSCNKVELYTRIKREWSGGTTPAPIYIVSQEADTVPVGEPGSYPEHLCPWQAPTWSLIAGENYGRGLVEDYAGGFAKLSDESHAAALYGIEASRILNLVAPGRGADVDELQGAETGEFVSGEKDAVTPYESGDGRKMQQMAASIEATFGRLARAFMYKANTRQAERVTAFELKQDALEAENTLGGVYSSLSASMQIPLAHVLLTEIDVSMLDGIINKDVALDIMAGIPALGRQADVQNLAAAAQDAAAIIPPLMQLDKRIDPRKLMDIILAGQSVDATSVYKDKKQLEEEEAAAKQEAAGQAQIANSQIQADQASQLQAIQG